ncbi:alpha-amylase family glycosyl hydrolase [Salipaludibacillus daqingensis]|uniref:alpha-amylase family glycosyl hydrolase n=1 Tax=Salipaludibacillus daqingensis TaxID=3041001 RepID=UPI0024749F7C|nr:alpha-amylase family glycosyl hydrolase [Salipaludibacillus daqingensis]
MKKFISYAMICFVILFFTACSDPSNNTNEEGVNGTSNDAIQYSPSDFPSESMELIDHFPETVFYEIFVRAFQDSSGDGIGDIAGMTERLDYLEELGIEALWLMPINPSPTYHGYDVTDYYDINPDYGSLDDFRAFIDQAHERGIKVIMDLVVNHASYEHEWFQEALNDKDSPYRDWFIWADEDTNVDERGEWGQNLWHGEEPNQYMSVFWEGMPDLNMDNQDVRDKIYDIGEFWLDDVGVDGFRLDAAKHIYPGEAEKNHQWWAEFRSEMEAVNEDVFLVGEVWDIPQVTGPYLERGFHSTFNFDLGENIIQAARQERGQRLVSSLVNVLDRYADYSDDYIDSTFLTNHDIDRVMSQLQGNDDRAKIAASLLLSLPGSPFIYYGEEIGMEGQKPDEHIREPMLWYDEPEEADGQTTWINPRHNRSDDAPSVENMKDDENSLWRHYQTWVHLRRSHSALLYGEIEESSTDGEGIVSFIRESDDERLLVIHNLSKESSEIAIADEDDVSTLYFSESDQTSLSEDNILNIDAYSSVILKKNN